MHTKNKVAEALTIDVSHTGYADLSFIKDQGIPTNESGEQCCRIGDFLNSDCYRNYNTVIFILGFYQFRKLCFSFRK